MEEIDEVIEQKGTSEERASTVSLVLTNGGGTIYFKFYPDAVLSETSEHLVEVGVEHSSMERANRFVEWLRRQLDV